MFNFRTSRTRFVGAAATVVLGALSLTACNNGTGTRDEGASAAATPTAHSSSSTAPSSTASPSASAVGSSATKATPTAGSKTPAAGATASKGPVSSNKPVTCEGSNTKTVAAPLNRPVNHMLLTVTNTGSRTCFLYGYPAVRFTDAQSVPPVVEESQPQAVVTLEPGQSGYAAIGLSATDGSGHNGYTAKDLTVYFYGRSLKGNVGKAAHPSLPAKGAYIDDSIKVTYWQQEMDDAINW